MPSVREWLRSLGLDEYADGFEQNRIDFSILQDLTDQDLKELGVVLGDRRRIMRAIAELETPRITPQAAAPLEPEPRDEAERRQVTVMFVDLVGSTALSVRMDPEDLRELISAYQKCVAETVRRFGGFVARYLGDGVLVYFGYPHAHEDDAERAVRAALELVAAMPRLATRPVQQIRIGIATGLVVVGHLIPSGEAEERAVVGETPNLAARLQALAEPNSVVIADSTRKLLGNLFELQDLGARELKGTAGPVRIWRAMRESAVASRFEAMHATGLTPLVGREEELELLLRRWSRAKAGEGQVVLLSGEPGIGKSRLTAALLERIGSEPHRRLRYYCSPQHTDSALYPIIGQLSRAAELAHDDTPQQKLDKLDALLALSGTSAQDAALLAEVLSLPNDGRHPVLDLTPQQRRHKTLEALIAQLQALARHNPVLMILEDAHWIDPTSLEVFDRAVERITTWDRAPNCRVLFIVTFRPEFEAPWVGRPHVATVTINRLAEREVDAMIDRVVGNKLILAHIKQDIIERTDGIPLFVEEITKSILEAESEGDALRTAAAIPGPTLAVPATLQASLMARLDRLGPAKEVAQIGAAIGREFSHALLAAIVHKPEAELEQALDRLSAAGLLFRQGMPPYASYLFKHALIRDAAYGTLLREPRRALHARIAEILETEFPDTAENSPELLARHCSEAGQIGKAARLWAEAGQRSLERSALVEGAEQLTHALEQIALLPPTPALRREQIKLQVALITPLLHVHGYAAPQTRAAVEQARLLIDQASALGEPPEDPLLLFSVLYGFWVANLVAFNGDVVRELAVEFLALAEKQGATVPRMIGHRLLGLSLVHTGEIGAGREHLDLALSLFDATQHRALASRFGQDVDVAILSWKSLALWLLGQPGAALADSERAVAIAREIGHAATLMYALTFTTWTYIQCGNYATAGAQADENVALSDQKGIVLWKGFGMMNQGQLLTLGGRAADAIHRITAAMSALRSTGTTMWIPLWLSYLARAYTDLGRHEEARHHIAEALSTVEKTKERWCEAEVVRIAGEIALLSSKPDAAKAQECFQRALAIGREQQAKAWQLRSALNLAQLWRDQDKRQEARELLTPIYDSFTEGFDTADLKQARALLDELSQ